MILNITESPWVIHDETHCPEEIYGAMEHIDGSARGQLVCTVNTWNVPTDRVLENAQLIRSAPDMLAALQFIVEITDEELQHTRVGTGAEVALRHANRRAREALAKVAR